MHMIAQYGSYYLPLTVKFHYRYTILNMKYMDCLWDSLQFALNVMKSISNKMLFKNIVLIIYVLGEF